MKKELLTIDGKEAVQIFEHYYLTKDGDLYCRNRRTNKIQLQKKRLHSNGYLRGIVDGKDVYLHRLVAMFFIENPNGYEEVNHKDGNKKNNSVNNLEWCNRSQNSKHAFQTGLRQYSELSSMARKPRKSRRRFTDEEIRYIRSEHEKGVGDKKLANEFSCARAVIWQIHAAKTYREVV